MSISFYIAVLLILLIAYLTYTQARRRQRSGGYRTRAASYAAKRGNRDHTWNGEPIRRCFYAVLEVDPRARQTVIRRAYSALMHDCHPDHGGDTEATIEINKAYEVLGEPATRHRYDIENGYC